MGHPTTTLLLLTFLSVVAAYPRHGTGTSDSTAIGQISWSLKDDPTARFAKLSEKDFDMETHALCSAYETGKYWNSNSNDDTEFEVERVDRLQVDHLFALSIVSGILNHEDVDKDALDMLSGFSQIQLLLDGEPNVGLVERRVLEEKDEFVKRAIREITYTSRGTGRGYRECTSRTPSDRLTAYLEAKCSNMLAVADKLDGFLLVGAGSPRPEWAQPFAKLQNKILKCAGIPKCGSNRNITRSFSSATSVDQRFETFEGEISTKDIRLATQSRCIAYKARTYWDDHANAAQTFEPRGFPELGLQADHGVELQFVTRFLNQAQIPLETLKADQDVWRGLLRIVNSEPNLMMIPKAANSAKRGYVLKSLNQLELSGECERHDDHDPGVAAYMANICINTLRVAHDLDTLLEKVRPNGQRYLLSQMKLMNCIAWDLPACEAEYNKLAGQGQEQPPESV